MTSYNFNKQGPIQIVLYHIHIKTNNFFNFQHISTLHIDHHFNRKFSSVALQESKEKLKTIQQVPRSPVKAAGEICCRH